ncbi:MAG: hypothetical protein VX498_15265 [Myxococcota bacterium]|nr:hypothetical protein [Myxococcota bacterium]
MTSVPAIDALLARLDAAVDESDPRLRARSEWKEIESLHRSLLEDRDRWLDSTSELEDLERDCSAKLDLLELARAEVAEQVQTELRVRESRLTEDEGLLTAIAAELRVYAVYVLLGFVLPPLMLLMKPLGALLALGCVPVLFGFARMQAVGSPARGRRWLVLQDRVDHVMGRVRNLHFAAATAVLLTCLWVLVSNLRDAGS